MRVVVALGGNALLRRGEPMTIENQRANVALACRHLAPVALAHELVVSHGNGPQIGLLALEGAAYEPVPAYPLDVLGAETQGMIGYLVESGLTSLLPDGPPAIALLTMVEVAADDPAFADPTKPIGPLYDAGGADALAADRGWAFKADGESMRRVVASPGPRRIVEEAQIRQLLERGSVVICAGGGGIPVTRDANGGYQGIEAVVDKDHASALLAHGVHADLLVLATDTPFVYLGWGTEQAQAVVAADPEALLADHSEEFAAGSMLPKVVAAAHFACTTGNPAVIGQLADIDALVAGTAGTRISTDIDGVLTAPTLSEED